MEQEKEIKKQAKDKPAKEKGAGDLKKQLKDCQQLARDYLAGWQRAKADFENYKKEEARRTGELIGFAKAGWLLELLRVFDNFERIEQHLPHDFKDDDWAKGVLMVKTQLLEFLKTEGVEEIKTEGEKFNPQFHEAVEQVEDKNKEAGRVVEVLEKGYLLNGRVLRPSKVKVAN